MLKHSIPKMQNKGKYISEFKHDYTVIDIETTGLSFKNDEIIEISALKIRNNSISGEFSSLIKPETSISERISLITGITPEMLSTAKKIEQVLPEFIDFVGNDTLLGHNVSFDINFIYDKYLKLSDRHFCNDYMDTRILAQKYCDTENNKRATLAGYYGINVEGQHRALNDCIITFNVYTKIMEAQLQKK